MVVETERVWRYVDLDVACWVCHLTRCTASVRPEIALCIVIACCGIVDPFVVVETPRKGGCVWVVAVKCEAPTGLVHVCG